MSKKIPFSIRAEKDLIDSFKRACDLNDYSYTLVIKQLMKSYIQNNSQLDILKGVKK